MSKRHEREHGEAEEIRLLREVLHELRIILRRLSPIPTNLTINLPRGEKVMASPKTYPIGTLTSLKATEFDTLVSPPAPFAYANGSVTYAQTGGAAVLVDNGDGTFVYPNTVAEVITVTATDSVSNPGTVLTDNAVITFQTPALLPNQLNIVLP
jgi:hypothetical protein